MHLSVHHLALLLWFSVLPLELTLKQNNTQREAPLLPPLQPKLPRVSVTYLLTHGKTFLTLGTRCLRLYLDPINGPSRWCINQC